MTEMRLRQQQLQTNLPAPVQTPDARKTHLMQLNEQLEAIQQQNRIRDEEFAAMAHALAELRSELKSIRSERNKLRDQIVKQRSAWHHEVEELHAAIYELSAQQRIGQSHGTDASQHIRYEQTIRHLRTAVREHLPAGASVLVVSRGDEALLKMYGRRASHFPQLKGGDYAGYYPKCGLAAIAHLETLRSQGSDYLIFPEPSLWWLDKYPDFRRHLEQRYHCIFHDLETGVIFSLREPSCWLTLTKTLAECRVRVAREPVALNWMTEFDFDNVFDKLTVFTPPVADAPMLPYLDRSIDLVAVPIDNPDMVAEARRVATQATILIGNKPKMERKSFTRSSGVSCDKSTRSPFTCNVEWLTEKSSAQIPSVSIVIPVHNHSATTESCLTSLLETLPESFAGEIIVIDDASTDDTPLLLNGWAVRDSRIRCLRNVTNQGFLETTRRGAAAATGDVLLFLNNDTVLLPDWLPPLLRVFRDFPLAGAVGGKLLFADGALQEAGGMVFRDGSAANFGRGDHDLDAPTYNFVREVDYCSGAFLATPRSLFEKIGGFDDRYRPAYYEDTDYCFAVRQQGYRVYYQPESAVVHLEGVSSGTDLSSGTKQYQVLNQAKFIEKWSAILALQPERPTDEYDRSLWNALALGHKTCQGDA